MEARKYCVYNRAKESTLSEGVTVIDTTLEPLKVLRVMIEGLAKNTDTGLWLTPLNEIPRVPRLAPFDLVYLDKDRKVIQGAELLPGIEFPAFEHSAESALVLPFKSMSTSNTQAGDQLAIEAAEEPAAEIEGSSTSPADGAAVDESKQSASPRGTTAETLDTKARAEKSVAASLLEKSDEFRAVETPRDKEARTTRPPGGSKAPRILAPKPKTAIAQDTPEAVAQAPVAEAADDAAEKAAERALERAARKTAAENPAEVFFRKPAVQAPEAEPAKPDAPAGIKPVPRRTPPSAEPGAVPVPARAAKAAEPPEAETAPPEADAPDKPKPHAVPPKPTVFVGKHSEATGRPELQDEEKVPVVTRVLRWLYPDLSPPQNSRRAIRRPAHELMAYYWVNGEPRPLDIRDISSSGVYVKTEERWQPGERISLILQRKGPLEESPERQFLVDAGAARWGDDGVGLAFILPPGMDIHIWEGPLKRRDDEKEPEYVLREFRKARALSFIRRICPSAVEEIDLFFHRELSNYRLSSAVEIVLKAEMMLMNEPNADQVSALPEMVVRILELGSWAEGDLLHQLWAGLLATCCTVEGNDSSNALFIDLLTPLTLTHARILLAACTKASKVISPRGEVTSYPLYFTADEIMKIAGTNDLSKIHRAVALMGDFGIFEKSAKSSFISATEKSKTTPTSLGFQLYARCSGHREVQP